MAKKKAKIRKEKIEGIDDDRVVELKQLAKDIVNNLIFTDRHIPAGHEHLLLSIFIPLSFLDKNSWGLCKPEDIGIIFEYHSKASPRSINGYPMFTSFRYLVKKESKVVLDYVKKYQEALDKIK